MIKKITTLLLLLFLVLAYKKVHAYVSRQQTINNYTICPYGVQGSFTDQTNSGYSFSISNDAPNPAEIKLYYLLGDQDFNFDQVTLNGTQFPDLPRSDHGDQYNTTSCDVAQRMSPLTKLAVETAGQITGQVVTGVIGGEFTAGAGAISGAAGTAIKTVGTAGDIVGYAGQATGVAGALTGNEKVIKSSDVLNKISSTTKEITGAPNQISKYLTLGLDQVWDWAWKSQQHWPVSHKRLEVTYAGGDGIENLYSFNFVNKGWAGNGAAAYRLIVTEVDNKLKMQGACKSLVNLSCNWNSLGDYPWDSITPTGKRGAIKAMPTGVGEGYKTPPVTSGQQFTVDDRPALTALVAWTQPQVAKQIFPGRPDYTEKVLATDVAGTSPDLSQPRQLIFNDTNIPIVIKFTSLIGKERNVGLSPKTYVYLNEYPAATIDVRANTDATKGGDPKIDTAKYPPLSPTLNPNNSLLWHSYGIGIKGYDFKAK